MYIYLILIILHLGTINSQPIKSGKDSYDSGVNEIQTKSDDEQSRGVLDNLNPLKPTSQQDSNSNPLLNIFSNLGNNLPSTNGSNETKVFFIGATGIIMPLRDMVGGFSNIANFGSGGSNVLPSLPIPNLGK